MPQGTTSPSGSLYEQLANVRNNVAYCAGRVADTTRCSQSATSQTFASWTCVIT
jgi:hypothetical protein